MRYEDWDILLFPQDCKIPLKEFKVACHVVHDAEFSHTHGSFGLPTVSCFVPSLAAGAPFQISIHHWTVPTISQATKAYTKYPDNVKFEARLFIDGRLVASTSLDRSSGWPHVMAHSFDFSKNGELKSLKFPIFRQELLQQSYWSPADDLRRIKIVLSEGFPRDSLSMPIERVKNLVAFSFQHAPNEILESSAIAWPNPSMWRRAPFTTSMPVPAYPSDDAESHAHSPRRRPKGAVGSCGYSGSAIHGIMAATSSGSGSEQSMQGFNPPQLNYTVPPGFESDPFGCPTSYVDWIGDAGVQMSDIHMTGQSDVGLRKGRRTSTDESMPDYLSSGKMSFTGGETLYLPTFTTEEDHYFGNTKVPTNTPTTNPQRSREPTGIPFPVIAPNSAIPADLATSLTNSLLNQPMPLQVQTHNSQPSVTEIRSRKENRFHHPIEVSAPVSAGSAPDHKEMRRVSQQLYMPSGSSVPIGMAQQQTNSPTIAESEANSQTPSNGRFGSDLTNMTTQDTSSIDGAVGSAPSSDKGVKRVRHFTPAPARALEDESDPLRGSPRVRLTPFPEDSPTPVVT